MAFSCKCNSKQCLGGVVYCLKRATTMNLQTFEPLSLRSYGHESNIVSNNIEESIHQYYVNESMKAVEAFYALPIENGVHVIILNMKLDGKPPVHVVSGDKNLTKHSLSHKYTIDWPNKVGSGAKISFFNMAIGTLAPGLGVEIKLIYVSKIQSNKNVFGTYDNPKATSHYDDNVKKFDNGDGAVTSGELAAKNCTKNEEAGNNDDEEDEGDEDHKLPWHDRPWGDFGRPWGDFGRPWKINRRPWGQYSF